MTQEFTGDNVPEAEPAFDFHTRPVNRAMTARLGQHNLPVKQRERFPGRDGADDESEAGPRDQEVAGTADRVAVIQAVFGNGCGGCDSCVDVGVVAVVVVIVADVVRIG